MATAKLVILRHGETTYNAERKLTGLHDAELTDKGEKQADLAGDKIRDIPFDKAYSSHLKRAFNTAARALKSSGTQEHLRDHKGDWNIDQRPALAEIDWGIYSGMSKDDPFVKAFSWNYDAVPENGESQEQACERIRQFYMAEIEPRLQRGENVLVVAHSGVSHAFDVVLGLRPAPAPGTPMMKNSVENAVPSIFEFENGKLARVISHAAGLGQPPAANKNNKHGPK